MEIKPGCVVRHRSNPKKDHGAVLSLSPYGLDWWKVDWGECVCHNCESELEVIEEPHETVDQEVERRR